MSQKKAVIQPFSGCDLFYLSVQWCFMQNKVFNIYINVDAVIERKEEKYSNASRNWYYNSGYLTRRNGADRSLTYIISINSVLYLKKANGNDNGGDNAFLI